VNRRGGTLVPDAAVQVQTAPDGETEQLIVLWPQK
jgi:hypothetical protein